MEGEKKKRNKELLTDKNRHKRKKIQWTVPFWFISMYSLVPHFQMEFLFMLFLETFPIHLYVYTATERYIHSSFFSAVCIYTIFARVQIFSSCEAMAFVQLDGFNASQKGILASHLFLFSLRSIKKSMNGCGK